MTLNLAHPKPGLRRRTQVQRTGAARRGAGAAPGPADHGCQGGAGRGGRRRGRGRGK